MTLTRGLALRSCAVLVLAAVVAAAAPAFAQDQDSDQIVPSRAALLAGEREKKATEATPPERSKVEKFLYGYDNGAGTPFLFQSWHGLHLGSAGFPAGAGTKFALGFTHDLGRTRPAADPNRANRLEVDSVAAYSTSGYSRGAASLTVHNLGGASLDLRTRGQAYEYPQEDFFGFGQDSRREDRTSYLLRSTEAGVDLTWFAGRPVEITGGVSYLMPTVGTGTDKLYPTTDQIFNPAVIPGYQRQSDFLRSDASIAVDRRDNPLYPHAGGRYAVQLSDYRDRDLDMFSFRRVTVDLQQYVPIPDRYRTIALHALAVFSDPDAGQDVPFYFQPTLGGAQALRGFREFRFQDRNSLLLTAEYRWEAWWALDGAFFVDAGQVAHRRQDFNVRDFDVSYGVGFRIHSNSAFAARLDLAFSREGFIPLLRFEHAF